MDAFQSIKEKVLEVWPADRWQGKTVLVGVSGGADSVALLRLLLEISKSLPNPAGSDVKESSSIHVAHFDHRTRDNFDSEFVSQLCRELKLPCHLGADTRDNTRASEEFLRQQRYDFLIQTANRIGSRYLALGHHEDDQIETVLFRIFRGTGLKGLTGIPINRLLQPGLTLVRPLLNVKKSELLNFLREWEQPFLEDPSNADTKFQRNWIRNKLLPEVKQRFNEKVGEAVRRLAELGQQMEQLLQQTCEPLLLEVEFVDEKLVRFSIEVFVDQPTLVVTTTIRQIWQQMKWPEQAMGKKHWDRIADLIKVAPPGIYMFPGEIRIEVNAAKIEMTRC